MGSFRAPRPLRGEGIKRYITLYTGPPPPSGVTQ